ncbi:MAG: LAGLIDADG family homing endonuclease [Candidatus Pacearchaeota archaeon]|jgi:DNA-binding transcriptional regulator WhiA
MKNILLPSSITPELAEETGWHIGDGSMNYYNNKGYRKGIYQLRGHIEDDKQHYLIRIKPLFKLLYGIDISLREMPSTRVFGFQIWNDNLVKFKEKLGLPLGKKFDVAIPEIFLNNNHIRIAVIRGIFDTDGCIYLQPKYGKLYPRLEITTISLKLAEQLLDLLNKLELRTTMHKICPSQEGERLLYYKVNIRGVEMFYKFMELIKPANPKHIKKYKFFKESFK